MDTCDPNAEIDDLRKLIKMNTGHSIKLTREQICQVYDDIQGGKLPLPPLVLDSKMSYLIDKKSPLTPKDFDTLFDSSSKRTDLKRIARKVGLVKTEQMTKNQIFDAIGKRLRYMNVHEPIKISRKRLLSSKSNTAANNAVANNAAVNNLGLNNAAANNAAANNLGLNNTGNSGNNTGNTGFNSTGNNVNRNRNRNFNNNSAFNSGGGSNNLSNNASSKPNSKVSFPNKSLFATMNKPDFAKNQENMSQPKPMFTGMMGTKTPNFINSNKKKTSFFGGLFGGSKNNNKDFIKANKFNKAKPGYVFKTGNQGLGYYKNDGPVVAQGPLKKPNGFGEPVAPVAPVGPNKPKNNKVNTGVGNNTINNKPNKPVNNKNNKVNTGVGNNTVNNKPNKPVNNKPNKVNTGVGNNTVNNKPNKPVNNKPNKVNTVNNKNNNGNTIMTNANNNKNNNGNTIMTNANNKENAAVQNNANNQARRNEENRKKAEKEAQEAKKREENEAKKEATREELRKRKEEILKKKEESKRIANIEKNLLSIPNVDKVYLTEFKGNKSVENLNKNALMNKVKKDVVIRNLRNQLSPLFMGKRRVAYVNPANYNSTKANIEKQITEKVAKKADLDALKKLSVNAAVSTNYVKAFANGKSFVNVSLNALKSKRNKDLEVYKLNATNKKGMFGGYSTTVPGTKTMKFIPNTEYNKSLNRAKTALQARRNAKQLAENKRKPKPANNTKSNNGNNKSNNGNNKLNAIEEEINKENVAIQNNTNNNFNASAELNKQLNIEANRQARNQNEKNFNASAELNKQLNNEAKRQNRAKNNNTNNNFNAAAELNKQLNNEAKRQNNNKKRANRAAKGNNTNNNFNAAAELNKQLNNTSKKQLENKRRQVRNKAEKHVAGFLGRIGMWNKQIKNANLDDLNALDKNLNKRIELKREINISKVPSKRELADKSKKYLMNVKNLRRIFEKELNNAENKKVSNVTGPLVKGAINKVVANNKIEKKRALLKKKANDEIGGAFFIGGIGRWAAPIRNAKTENNINKLNTNLNERIKLKREIRGNRNLNKREKDKIISNIMKFDVKISNLKKKYENERNKKISNTTGPLVKGILNKVVANNKRGSFNGGLRLGNNNNNIINGKPKPIYNNSNSNNNTNKINMKPNPTFEPNMTNNPTFENNKPKITNENKKPLISTINSLKQLPQNKKTIFKGRINSAFKNQNLNKMKAIRNEAIAANKTIQNQLIEEKRLKEEAKEAQRKKEAENAARRKAEREAKKKAANEEAKKKAANNMKRQLNAANNILNLANKALKKKENNKAPTLMERGSYTSKINTQMKKLAKGTTNRVREDWEKKKRTFKGRITRAATIGQVKKAYENAKEEYNKLK